MTDDKIQLLRCNDLQPHQKIKRFVFEKQQQAMRKAFEWTRTDALQMSKGAMVVRSAQARRTSKDEAGRERRREPERSVLTWSFLRCGTPAASRSAGLLLACCSIGVVMEVAWMDCEVVIENRTDDAKLQQASEAPPVLFLCERCRERSLRG